MLKFFRLSASVCCLLTVALAAGCGTTVTTPDGDVIDLDGIDLNDIDLDGLDVDQDILSQLDIQKPDTTGTDTDVQNADTPDIQKDIQPDVQPDIQPDVQEDIQPDIQTADTPDTQTVDVPPECTTAVACDDSNPCTQDECTVAGTCTHTNTTTSCNDGNACTTDDICGNGVCAGSAKFCADDNPCTDDSCAAGECVFLANAATCDDGNACTLADTCTATTCVGTSTDSACNDDVACTIDSCTSEGCIHLADDVTCSDGNICTDDSCNVTTGCVNLANTATCSDNDACSQTDTCSEGACIGSNPVICPSAGPCATSPVCNPADGECSSTTMPADTTCTDNNECTIDDICNGSDTACHGTQKSCEDSNECTEDTCDPEMGCNSADLTGPACSDSNVCTQGDYCSDGFCIPGESVDCADDVSCTVNTCDMAMGCTVEYDHEACADDANCTIDTCTESGCTHGPKCTGGADVLNCSFPTCSELTGECGTYWTSFYEDFQGGGQGWTLEGEWQIGLAKASTQLDSIFFADPDYGQNGENTVAGTVIGGDISNTPHGYYYLTSPAIDLSAVATSEYSDWGSQVMIFGSLMVNLSAAGGQTVRVEVSGDDGKSWTPLESVDAEYKQQSYFPFAGITGSDLVIPEAFLTQHFRFRIGYQVASVLDAVVPIVSGITLDGIYISVGSCWD